MLADRAWKLKYTPDDGDLVELFYVPVLEDAERYDRLTGYFNAGALALAARGIEGLVRNAGRMRLVVGCTLEPSEIEAIERGEALRDLVEQRLASLSLAPPDPASSEALELLAWMIARGHLEVKVAVPCDPDGRPIPSDGIFHEKAGIVADRTGDRLAWNGSLNETAAGWRRNWESINVYTSWGPEPSRVDDEEAGFARIWANRARRVIVLDVPDAVRRDLMRFMPESDTPARLKASDAAPVKPVPPAPEDAPGAAPAKPAPDDTPDSAPAKPAPEDAPDPAPAKPASEDIPGPAPAPPVPEDTPLPPKVPEPSPAEPPEQLPTSPPTGDLRSRVWAFIARAPSLPGGGIRVGEATAAVTPWPHQIKAFERLYGHWPPRLLIADEVGLGKTIQAGLLLRQAWLSGRAKRILILAPKAVLGQWQIELREKFNLNWPIYDGRNLVRYPSPALRGRHRVEAGPHRWHEEPAVIASSHLMRRRERAAVLLEEAEPWDLVVLDEAHHARRRAAGAPQEGGPNALLRLMRGLEGRTQGLVLLTATPMQVHPVEVWDLLHLLGLPPEWTAEAFLRFFEDLEQPSPSAQALDRMAGLFRAVERAYGEVATADAQRLTALSRFKANKVLRALRDPASIPRRQLETGERRAALRIVQAHTPLRRLVSRHTRALLRRYFQAGMLTTPIAERSVKDRFVDMTPEERALYGAVEEYIASTYNQAGAAERTAVGFVMTIYRRRLASSFHALRATLRKHLDAIAVDERGRLVDSGLQSGSHHAEIGGIATGDRGRLTGLDEDDRSRLTGSDRASWERGRLARNGPEDDRGRLTGSDEDGRSRLASSDEDAPDDETTDEMPDTDEIAELERRALAVEEAHDIERLLDGIARLPPDSKLESLKGALRELKEVGFAQTMVFSQFTDTMDFLREALRGGVGSQTLRGEPGSQALRSEVGPQTLRGEAGPRELRGEAGPRELRGGTGLQALSGEPGPQALRDEPGSQALSGEAWPRLMCFSGRGGEIPTADGGWRTISRDEAKRRFRDGEADVLLCTDAAAEGLNFQFCGALVNYDMPWNPMRVEQRIGRIDRLGQAHPVIRIVNLHYEGTIETDVYRALRSRIGLFETVVGRLQPILAQLPRTIADAVVSGAAGREGPERASVTDAIERQARQAEAGGFDLDAALDADVTLPDRPPSPVTMEDLDRVIGSPGLMPPGTDVQPLAPREYGLLAPGMRERLRVTTDPMYYEEHAESVELWSPGNPLFSAPEFVAATDEPTEKETLQEILGG